MDTIIPTVMMVTFSKWDIETSNTKLLFTLDHGPNDDHTGHVHGVDCHKPTTQAPVALH